MEHKKCLGIYLSYNNATAALLSGSGHKLNLHKAFTVNADPDLDTQSRVKSLISQLAKKVSELGLKFCHRCEYCMPCEKGVTIPGVLAFKSVSRRLPPMAAIGMAYGALESVEKCEDCGVCIEKCPYDLPIPDLLKENLALYNDFKDRHQ